jgi:hypothetical protein
LLIDSRSGCREDAEGCCDVGDKLVELGRLLAIAPPLDEVLECGIWSDESDEVTSFTCESLMLVKDNMSFPWTMRLLLEAHRSFVINPWDRGD